LKNENAGGLQDEALLQLLQHWERAALWLVQRPRKEIGQRPTWAHRLSGGSKDWHIRTVVERVWNRCDGCSVLSFAPDPRTLALVTVDGTPVSYDSWEHADKIVLVTKGEGRKLDTMDRETRFQQFDKRLLVLVQNGWKQ
jgi:hypothetical protein